jgi:prevent-host-death family protein
MLYKMYKTSDSIPRVSVSDARESFADLVNRVAYGGERIVVARHGRDLVGIVSMADVQRLATIGETASPGPRPTAPVGVGGPAPKTRPGPRA